MRMISDLMFRLKAIFTFGKMQRELDEELAFHLEMESRKHRAQGMDEEAARRAARRSFGNMPQQRERAWDSWGVGLVQDIKGDVRFSLRQLRRNPAFTVAAVLTLALGIGATTTIFSLVNGILLQPLSYSGADRVVAVWPGQWVSKPFFLYLEESATSYEALAGWAPKAAVLLGEEGAERLWGPRVTAGFFDVLGPDVAAGRTFGPGDDRRGADVVVISYGLWQRRFAGDPGVIGRRIRLRGADRTIIGVMDRDYHFLQRDADVAVPQLMEEGAPGWGYSELQLVGRLKRGVDREQAAAELRALAAGWRADHGRPDDWGTDARVDPLRERLVGGIRPALLLLFAACGLTLLIATANVASLLVARALSRRREISVRLALGAKPSRLVRQLLTESTFLGVLGGALGLGTAIVGLRGLIALLPAETPRLDEVHIDGFVLAFCLLLALTAGWVAGLTPALQSRHADLREGIAGGSRSGTEPGSRRRLRAGIVITQVALAVTLLSGCGLLVKSFWHIVKIEPGFQPKGLVSFDLHPQDGRLKSPDDVHSFYRLVSERLQAIPGVVSVAGINAAPFAPDGWILSFYAEDRPPAEGTDPPIGRWRPVTPGYFRTAGVPLLEGRFLNAGDRGDGEPVAVISKGAASRLWPDESALGKRVVVRLEQNTPVRVVGVVGDVKALGLDHADPPTIYRPFSQVDAAMGRVLGASRTLVLRTEGDPEGLAAQVRSAVLSEDRFALVQNFQPLPEAISESLSQRRVLLILVTLFAANALLLAAVGVYGMMTYAVRARTKEMAIRVALGASRRMVIGRILREGLRVAALGTLAGLALALALSRTLSSFVFEIRTVDPWVLGAAAAVSIFVASLASYRPAHRAAAADPKDALSAE